MSFRMPDFHKTQRVMAYLTLALCCVSAGRMLQACSGSPPPTGRDLQTAVNLSRDACQRLLDATEAPLPEADGGAGGGP